MENFSAWLKDALDAAGMTPRQLALDLKLSPQTIINYLETNKAHPGKKKMVYDYFEKLNGTPAPEEEEEQLANPGLNNDGYLALQAQIEGLIGQIETLKDYNATLKTNNAELWETNKVLRSQLGFPKGAVASDTEEGAKTIVFTPKVVLANTPSFYAKRG